ncbi:hypothetical protein C9374_006398 [Naegleria lovaniensis]|uniref:Uncharacterized protein n=1 Tax=Naegleria lovaniensis TaxID=51637 RepID=A0AA88KH57_NAELO|nr:uncharacterized protein C9374_006398 [Naegleria lovaniensis]KAG2381409.1 hypothetical protein C9374_006398 [Naegleria lovaniensis]
MIDPESLSFYWEKYWKIKLVEDRQAKFQVEEWCALHLKNNILNHEEKTKAQDKTHHGLNNILEICKYWILHDCLQEHLEYLHDCNFKFIRDVCFGEYWDLMLIEYVKYRWIEEVFEREALNRTTTAKGESEAQQENLLINKSVLESVKKNNSISDIDFDQSKKITSYYAKSIHKNYVLELLQDQHLESQTEHELEQIWQSFPDIYSIDTTNNVIKNQQQLLKVLLYQTLQYVTRNYGGVSTEFLENTNKQAQEALKKRVDLNKLIEKLCTYIRNFQKQTYSIDLTSFLWKDTVAEKEFQLERENYLSKVRYSTLDNCHLDEVQNVDEEEMKQQFIERVQSMYRNILENDPQIKEMRKKPLISHGEFNPKLVEKFKYKTAFYNIYFHVIYSEFVPLIEKENLNRILTLMNNCEKTFTQLITSLLKHSKRTLPLC